MSAAKQAKVGSSRDSSTQPTAEPYQIRDAREQFAILRAGLLDILTQHTDAKNGLDVTESGRFTIEEMTLAIANLEADFVSLSAKVGGAR